MNPLQDYLDLNNPKYDPDLPTQVNLPHQQYEAYGIYSIGAVTHRESARIKQFTSFVAWQKYDIHPVTVDFRLIAERYGNNEYGTGSFNVGGY